MVRDKIKNLISWKDSKYRKPLIVRGARQVGKTWLIREFGKLFEYFIEINFEKWPEFSSIFERGLKPDTIVMEISAAFEKKIEPGKTLLFFDEIQESPVAMKSLRYFYEEMPDLHIVAAGSLLGFSLKEVPTGVGRISYLDLYPMTFGEFLTGSGNSLLRERVVQSGNIGEALPEILHKKLLDLTRIYFLIGGMPSVVKAYIDTGDFKICQQIQSDLIRSFVDDFVKYSQKKDIVHLNSIFSSIPIQLGNKFVYSKVNKDIRSHHFSNALELLETAGLIYKVYHSKGDACPLRARMNASRFKVIIFDIGLLQKMLNVDLKLWMTDIDISNVYNGGIAEQFVGQEFAAMTNDSMFSSLYYWSCEKRGSIAEVDYLLELGTHVVPVEVKANVKGGMKSMHMFINEKKSEYGIKISKYPFSFDKNIKTIPFYGIETIF